MSPYVLRHLSDAVLAEQLAAATADDRRSVARHIAHIAEYDRRRLFVAAGCASMFRYCVRRLGMSEDVAFKRIQAGRAARANPGILGAIAAGTLSVSAVVLIAPHLTRDNAGELLAAAAHRTLKQVRRLLAERFGPEASARGDAALLVPPAAETSEAPAPCTEKHELDSNPVAHTSLANPQRTMEPPSTPPASPVPISPARRARLAPIGPGAFELVAILGQQAYDQLVASRELLGHAVPSGDLAEVLERAIALQFAHLRKRRCAAAERPRQPAAKSPADPRRVPDAVRRKVWERDGGQCTFVGEGGHVCGSRERLELDHVVPVAHGGQATVENLRLLCRVHNQYAAEREFGKSHMDGRREVARRRRTEERMRRLAERERAAAKKAEMDRQHDELGGALRNLGYRGEDLRRALALCAARADAPMEERLRYTLGRMAPNARREVPAAGSAE